MRNLSCLQREAELDHALYRVLERHGLLLLDGQPWHASHYVRAADRALSGEEREQFLEAAAAHNALARKLLHPASEVSDAGVAPGQLPLFV